MQAMDVRILTDRQLRSEIETLRKTLIMTKEFLWDEGAEIKNILGGLVREQSRRLSKFTQTERGPLYGQPPPPPPPPRQCLRVPPPPPPYHPTTQPRYCPPRDSWGSASSPRTSSSSVEESLASMSNDVAIHDSSKVGSSGKPSTSHGVGNTVGERAERSHESSNVTRAMLLAERLDDVLSTVSDGLSPHERDVIVRSLTELHGDGGVKLDVPPPPGCSSKAYRTHPDAPTWDQIPLNSQAYHVDVQRDNQEWDRGRYHPGGYHHHHHPEAFQNWRYDGPHGPPPPPPPGPPPPPPPGPPPPPPPGPPPSRSRHDDHFWFDHAAALSSEITPVSGAGDRHHEFMYSDPNDFCTEWDDENHMGCCSQPLSAGAMSHTMSHFRKSGNRELPVVELDTAMRSTMMTNGARNSGLPSSSLQHPGAAAAAAGARGCAGGPRNSMRSEQYLDSMLYKSSLSSNSGLCNSWTMNCAPPARDVSMTTDSWWGSKIGNSVLPKNPTVTSESTVKHDMRMDDTADMQFIVNSRYSSETDLVYPSPAKDDCSKAEGAALKSLKLLPQTLANFFRIRGCRRKTGD